MFTSTFKIFVVLTLALVTTRCHEVVELRTSFHKLGKLASGLGYAHLHTKIDIASVRRSHWYVMTKLNNTADLAKEFATKDKETDPLFVRLLSAMQPATFIIDAVTSTFVDSSPRKARQLELAAAAFSIGLSIYNTYEIYNLKNQIGDIRAGVEHVAHALLQEDQAIDALTSSIGHLNKTCNILAKSFYQLEEKVNKQAAFDELMLQITSHNQQVSQWGEGMTVLLHGHLSPLLIKNKSMMAAFIKIKEKVGLGSIFL